MNQDKNLRNPMSNGLKVRNQVFFRSLLVCRNKWIDQKSSCNPKSVSKDEILKIHFPPKILL
ncbi:hypothetical protein A0128_01440 [Leptospira tipperaryensis]|uniref:Uncharacterized protein n=1 Tax=Leptospira tipperaryensis TaxID=2564040 RepID=A0A1D7USW5_9LEPT|nr:hypothetical protein A0128_01440 [Leptospira tipperaryensis]